MSGRICRIAARDRRPSDNDKGPTTIKNVTRESTAALRDWLETNRTNPYPTKMEKILLAFVSKMTYTQVPADTCNV